MFRGDPVLPNDGGSDLGEDTEDWRRCNEMRNGLDEKDIQTQRMRHINETGNFQDISVPIHKIDELELGSLLV